VDNDFDEDAELGDDNFSHDGMMADPITDGGVDANMPIFDPREYFLMAFLVWIGKVFEESRSLVGAVENGIEEFVKAHPPFKILLKQGQINDEFLHISQWESRTFDLLKRLLGNLSNLLVVWDRFSGPNGDIHYFTDLRTASPRTRTHISGLLVGIAEKFAELEDLKQKLKELEDRCRTYQADSQHNERVLMVLSHQISHRSIQLMVESNHAAERSGTATDITILVLPFALVSAFFSIPGDDMSFKRTPRSFVIAVFGFTIGIQVFLWLSRNRRIQHKTGKPTEESEDVTEVHTLDIGNIANGYWNFPTFRRKPLDSETAGIV
jgi:hypothetical protein